MLQADAKPQLLDEIINEELQAMRVIDVPICDIYSAPSKWNEWNRLPEDKILQLCQSIVEIGQQAPCILWKMDKAKVLSLYDSGEQDAYQFVGDKYMILSGHNRALAELSNTLMTNYIRLFRPSFTKNLSVMISSKRQNRLLMIPTI